MQRPTAFRSYHILIATCLFFISTLVGLDLHADEDSDNGMIASKNGNYRQAIRLFESHLSRHPCSSIYSEMANCYYKLGDLSAADRYSEIAVSYGVNSSSTNGSSHFAGVLGTRGEVLRDLRRFEEAEKHFLRAIGFTSDKGYRAKYYFSAGLCQLERLRGTDALKSFLLADAEGYDKKAIYQASGRALMVEQEFSRALEKFELAIDESPTDISPYLSRVIIFSGTGRWQDAIREAKLDCNRTRQIDDGSQIMAIAGYLAAKKSGLRAPESILQTAQAQCDKRQWPYPIIRWLLGELSSAGLYELATTKEKMTDVQSVFAILYADSETDGGSRQRWVLEQGDRSRLLYDLVLLNSKTNVFSKPNAKGVEQSAALTSFQKENVRPVKRRPYTDAITGAIADEVYFEKVDPNEISSIKVDSPDVVMKRVLIQKGYTEEQATELIKMAKAKLTSRSSDKPQKADSEVDSKEAPAATE